MFAAGNAHDLDREEEMHAIKYQIDNILAKMSDCCIVSFACFLHAVPLGWLVSFYLSKAY